MGDTERERLIATLLKETIESRAEELRARLRELIPAKIEVWDNCIGSFAVVVAAPHVSFDGWTEYFCNRIAPALRSGRVVAKNFRDDNEHDIPVSIGRHIHVNRPTESRERGGAEFESERAQEVCNQYILALHRAGGRNCLDLLIEIHGHHRHEDIETATTGLDACEAATFSQLYSVTSANNNFPRLLIEPLDKLYFTAEAAKRSGSLRSDVTKRALHIEIPKLWRDNAAKRESLCMALCEVLKKYVTSLKTGAIS